MKSNMLGNIVAENDADMLDRAFYETPDYKSLLESNDRCVIVGRRGTGKSALVHRLNAYWWKKKRTFVISLAPEEAQVIGLRGTFSIFGDNFVHVKAASKISWRYALYMEIISKISNHYKMRKLVESFDLARYLKEWGHPEVNFASKLRMRLKSAIDKNSTPEENIADLSSKLELDIIEDKLIKIIKNTDYEIIVLIDRLDEGYTPDQLGVALADGFVQANIDLNSKFNSNIRGLVFLRDNMYRSISINDPDFTRNIEGQVLRLHWDEYGLFNMVCNRLRIAKNSSYENNTKLWSQYTARELKGRDGFRLALRLTLYRPRDILVLLNNAFLNASSQDRDEIVPDDIELSAKSISENRYHDLIKEYDTIFPALQLFTSSFSSSSAELSIEKARALINPIISRDDHDIHYQRDVAIFENSDQVLQRLYGIGFLGIKDINSSSYVFCHDGRELVKETNENSTFLIHPCYWLALNVHEKTIDKNMAEDIYDEYDIEISSITEEQRKTRIGRLIEEIKSIEVGSVGCLDFEDWCFRALKIIFAGSLTNFDIHPNKNGRQQRDITATNMAENSVWRRILDDYNSRQIVFEVKNYSDLSSDEYRQMNTYLVNEHGKLGFFITRSNDNNLQKGKELDWVQELYFNNDKKIVIKLSEKYITKHLSKLRSPQKHDAANVELNKLLDTYIRQYLILKAK
ncbi:ATP-binding protein [Vibrio fluvialis]|nr:ATP-binding protein [Vibrio fluvialis]